MEKLGWVPVVLSGAFPRGASDALAMITIAIASVNYSPALTGSLFTRPGIWFLALTIAFVTALASRSDAARKLREELALVAYGGSSWQIWLRYFVRGLVLTLMALLPLLYTDYLGKSFKTLQSVPLALAVSVIGAIAYASPGLARIRSKEFAENYKG